MTDTVMHHAGPSGAGARLGAVMIHGRGAGAHDILGLLGAVGLPDIAAVAPEAPGASWWPTSFLAPASQMAPFVTRGLHAVEAAFSALEAEGVPSKRIALIGFSQGACLALEYAARSGRTIHSVYGLSGGLVGTCDKPARDTAELYGFDDKSFDYASDLSGLPVYLGCHESDPHIPLKRVQDTARVLSDLGASVSLEIMSGHGHGVTNADVTALRAGLNGAASLSGAARA